MTRLNVIPVVSRLRRVVFGAGGAANPPVDVAASFKVGHVAGTSREPYPEPMAAVRERRLWERALGDGLLG